MSQQAANTTATYDVEPTERLSQAVVKAVAEAEGVGPLDLPPLYDTIDPDSLDSLFHSHNRADDASTTQQVTFAYHGYEVTVSPDNGVDLAKQ